MKTSQLFQTSYSALQTFKQCPQKYKFQAIDKIRAPKSKEAVFGSIIHSALKFFHSKYPVSPTLDELLNYFKDNWDSTPFQKEEDIIYFGEGIKILKNYYQYFLKNKDKFTVLDTESYFKIFVENPKTNQKCILAGKIDRIDKLPDGTIEIVDYKTTKRLPSQAEVDNDLQLSLYCLAISVRWPNSSIENIKSSFYYLKHKEILSTRRTKKQLREVKNNILEIVKEIEKSDFKPLPSVLCDWCGYKKICSMWKHKFSKKVDDEEIQNTIKEFLELKKNNQKNNKRLTALKEIINNYLDQEKIERVFGESGHITRLSQIRNIYDLKKLNKDQLEKIKQEKKYTILKSTLKKIKN